MKFQHDDEIWQRFPSLVPAVLTVDAVHAEADTGAAVAAWLARARERLAQGSESDWPPIQAWRRAFGAGQKDFVSASETVRGWPKNMLGQPMSTPVR